LVELTVIRAETLEIQEQLSRYQVTGDDYRGHSRLFASARNRSSHLDYLLGREKCRRADSVCGMTTTNDQNVIILLSVAGLLLLITAIFAALFITWKTPRFTTVIPFGAT
jgi:hypothetical protein